VANGVLLKNRIKKAMAKKGFSVVEAISPCTTLFGPKNNLRQPVAFLRHLKEKGVPLSRFKTMDQAAQQGFFPTGEFVDDDAPDFTTRYEAARQRIMARKGGGNG
jgi:2-oxoglutarate ferredoxin oxidoreductase subunit beta